MDLLIKRWSFWGVNVACINAGILAPLSPCSAVYISYISYISLLTCCVGCYIKKTPACNPFHNSQRFSVKSLTATVNPPKALSSEWFLCLKYLLEFQDLLLENSGKPGNAVFMTCWEPCFILNPVSLTPECLSDENCSNSGCSMSSHLSLLFVGPLTFGSR